MIMVPRKKVCDERKRKKGKTRQINVAKGEDRRGEGVERDRKHFVGSMGQVAGRQ